MENEKLRQLEKKFIQKRDLEEKRIAELTEGIMNYAVVDEDGFVKISHNVSLSQRERVWLVLGSRYLANKLQLKLGRDEVISAEVKAPDIAEMFNKDRRVVSARLKELHDDGRAIRVSRGTYRANPHRIENLLESLEEETG